MERVEVEGYGALSLADIMPLPSALEKVRVPIDPADPDSLYYIEVEPARTAAQREELRAALQDGYLESRSGGLRVGGHDVPGLRGPIQFLRLCFARTVTDYCLPTPESVAARDPQRGVTCPAQVAPHYRDKRAEQIARDFETFIGAAHMVAVTYLERAFRQVHRCDDDYLGRVVEDLGNSGDGASASAPSPSPSNPSSETAPLG